MSTAPPPTTTEKLQDGSSIRDDLSNNSQPIATHAAHDEVFQDESMRRSGWIRAAIFMLKMTFGAGVLSLPTALYELGAVAGVITILFWGCLNTYMAQLQGRFKILHPRVHTVSDSAGIAAEQLSGNPLVVTMVKEIVEFDYILTWIIAAGLTTLGLSISLNAVSEHAICSVWFGFISFIVVSTIACIRKIENLAAIGWIGFVSVIAAILTVLIAVSLRDRPAAAPQSGDFDLGFSAWPAASASFASAWAAALIIFSASANTSGFVPVISEMKRPQDFFKSVYWVMGFITLCYAVIGMIMFSYAGKWLSSPSLGSAGPEIKKIAYGLAMPGLIAGAMICVHVGGKSLYVRILRKSEHLHNEKSWVNIAAWFGSVYGIGAVSWIIAESIPFFGSLLTVVGALGFGPLGVCLPIVLWFCMNEKIWYTGLKGKFLYVLHALIFLLGCFITVAGTYAAVVTIKDQLDSGDVGKSFQCADNSGTVVSD